MTVNKCQPTFYNSLIQLGHLMILILVTTLESLGTWLGRLKWKSIKKTHNLSRFTPKTRILGAKALSKDKTSKVWICTFPVEAYSIGDWNVNNDMWTYNHFFLMLNDTF